MNGLKNKQIYYVDYTFANYFAWFYSFTPFLWFLLLIVNVITLYGSQSVLYMLCFEGILSDPNKSNISDLNFSLADLEVSALYILKTTRMPGQRRISAQEWRLTGERSEWIIQ